MIKGEDNNMLERPVVKIAPDTYLVSEYKLVNMFLVVGKHRAALIDTGGGIGPLPEDIERLTGLPLVVIATHGDPDHVGGAGHFPHVYLHPLDWEHSRRFPLNNTMRKWFVKTRALVRNPDNERKIDALVPRQELPQPEYLPLADGDVFDLGGRTLEVIHTPGHSPGSICLLDKENRLLFTGDTVNVSMALTGHDFHEYNASLRRLWARESEFDSICIGHELPALREKQAIARYISMTDRLMSGEAAAVCAPDAIRVGKVFRENGLEIWCDCEA